MRIRELCMGLTTLFLAAAIAGCSGGDNGTPASVPTVSATSPANLATGVAIDRSLAVTFSEAMDPASITAATFTVTGPGAVAVAGTVTYTGVTGLFNPDANLAANTEYTATIAIGALSAAGNSLASSYSWRMTTGALPDTTKPTVLSNVPANAATGVSIDGNVTVTFSEPINASTITATTFTLKRGTTPVIGIVSYAGVTATFNPTQALTVSSDYTATIISAVDAAGNALASSHSWVFTTADAPDTAAPIVASTIPLKDAFGVVTTAVLQVTFSEAMAPLTITDSTFTLTGPGGVAVPGSVVIDGSSKVATFQLATAMVGRTIYVATVKGGVGGVTDLAGNALASNHSWTFTSGAQVPLSPVDLGSAGNYVILAESAISTIPDSVVTGDVALSPAAASFITGFSLTTLPTTFSTSSQVTGQIFAADYAAPTPSNLTTAVADMQLAYTDAAGRPTPDFLELGTGAIGGMTLWPGLYKWAGAVTIPTNVTITGNATDVWIFQIAGSLTMASATNVFLSGGALAKNIFWQVAGTVTVGTTAHLEGIVLSKTGIVMKTGSTLNGRALAQTAVTLDTATVTQPAP